MYLDGLYKVIPLEIERRTKGVYFDMVPQFLAKKVDSIERVHHDNSVFSPGSVGDVSRPWYMHPFQDDYLMTLQGTRSIELYNFEHDKIEKFELSRDYVKKDGKIIYDGAAILHWPKNVFHRNASGENGSTSINLAVRYKGFNIDTEFNIYDIDFKNKKAFVIRKGALDQPISNK